MLKRVTRPLAKAKKSLPVAQVTRRQMTVDTNADSYRVRYFFVLIYSVFIEFAYKIPLRGMPVVVRSHTSELKTEQVERQLNQ